jgi:hypothetical protein
VLVQISSRQSTMMAVEETGEWTLIEADGRPETIGIRSSFLVIIDGTRTRSSSRQLDTPDRCRIEKEPSLKRNFDGQATSKKMEKRRQIGGLRPCSCSRLFRSPPPHTITRCFQPDTSKAKSPWLDKLRFLSSSRSFASSELDLIVMQAH